MKSKSKAVAKSNKTPKAEVARKSRIRVLIADDHSVVREGLVSLISRRADMTVVGEASNGREAVDLWKRTPTGCYLARFANAGARWCRSN